MSSEATQVPCMSGISSRRSFKSCSFLRTGGSSCRSSLGVEGGRGRTEGGREVSIPMATSSTARYPSSLSSTSCKVRGREREREGRTSVTIHYVDRPGWSGCQCAAHQAVSGWLGREQSPWTPADCGVQRSTGPNNYHTLSDGNDDIIIWSHD